MLWWSQCFQLHGSSGFCIIRMCQAFCRLSSRSLQRRRGGIGPLVWYVICVHSRRKSSGRDGLQLGIISCTFRQTNIIWLLYAYASSQLTYLRFRRAPPGGSIPAKLHDPPALAAGFRSSPLFFIFVPETEAPLANRLQWILFDQYAAPHRYYQTYYRCSFRMFFHWHCSAGSWYGMGVSYLVRDGALGASPARRAL